MIRALVGLAVGAAICFGLSKFIMGFLTSTMYAVLEAQGYPPEIRSLHPAESFITELKVSLIVGFILSAPYSLMQIWGFIAAGLYPHERRWVNRFAPVSIALFFTGAAFLLIVVSPLLLNFLIAYRTEYPNYQRFFPSWLLTSGSPVTTTDHGAAGPPARAWSTTQPIAAFDGDPTEPPEGVPWLNKARREIRIRFDDKVYRWTHLRAVQHGNVIMPEIRIGELIPFILQLAAAFGIGFQVPVVVAFLAAAGIAEASGMARLRRYVIFVMAIGSAVITPPDPGSMIMLLVPMVLLFEVGLFAARIIERKRQETSPSTP
jgi:Sec-independent protein secretion pathway component TatC